MLVIIINILCRGVGMGWSSSHGAQLRGSVRGVGARRRQRRVAGGARAADGRHADAGQPALHAPSRVIRYTRIHMTIKPHESYYY